MAKEASYVTLALFRCHWGNKKIGFLRKKCHFSFYCLNGNENVSTVKMVEEMQFSWEYGQSFHPYSSCKVIQNHRWWCRKFTKIRKFDFFTNYPRMIYERKRRGCFSNDRTSTKRRNWKKMTDCTCFVISWSIGIWSLKCQQIEKDGIRGLVFNPCSFSSPLGQ